MTTNSAAAESTAVHRLGAGAGVAFVVLFLVSTLAGGSDLGGPDFPAETIARDMTSRSDGLVMSAAFIGLSAVAGFWFIGYLHHRFSTLGRSPAVWATFAGGIGMVMMVLATSTFSQAAIVVDSLVLDPQVAKTLWLIEHGSWALLGPPQIAFILGVSVIAITREDPPRWVGYSGVIVAVGLVANMLLGQLGSLAALGLLWVLGLAMLFVFRAPRPPGTSTG